MLPVELTDAGVMIIRLQADLDIDSRALVAWEIDSLVSSHRPSSVVLELHGSAIGPAAVSTIARTDRLCAQSQLPCAVVSGHSDTRRALLAHAGTRGPGVYDTLSLAVAAVSPVIQAAA